MIPVRNRVSRVANEHLKNLNTPTITGKIVSVSADSETVLVDIGSASVSIAHPFVSGNSWIRALPSIGTSCTLSFNQTSNRYDFVAYAPTPDYASQQLDDYSKKKSLYRSLREGEIEIASSGGATLHMGSRPAVSGRAGAIVWSYNSDRLEASTTAPTTVVRGHNNKNDRIGNEMRFGVVKRPVSATSEMYALTAPLSMPALDKYVYAYEHLVTLSNDMNAPLIDFRSGEVYDDTLTPGIPFAMPALGKKSNLPLRARYRYFCTIEPGGLKIPGQSLDFEVSCLGDLDVMFPQTAIQGMSVDVPLGSMKLKSGLGSSFTSKLAVLIKSEIAKITLDAGAGLKLTTPLDIGISAGTEVTVDGVSIKVNGKGQVEIHGAAGLSLSGSMGKTGRKINTQEFDFVTGLPTFADPTLTA